MKNYSFFKSKLLAAFLLFSMSLSVAAAPVAYATQGAGAEAYYVPSSYEHFSAEEVVLSIVGSELFEEAKMQGLTEGDFKTLCKDQPKLNEKLEELLDLAFENPADYADICSSIASEARVADVGENYCAQLKEKQLTTCPVDEDKLVRLCEARVQSESKFKGAEEDDLFACEIEFQKNKKYLNKFCKGEFIQPEVKEPCPDPSSLGNWKEECTSQGGQPAVTRNPFTSCEVPTCEFEKIRPPIVFNPRGPIECPSIMAGWDEMCRRTGGKPVKEFKGQCVFPKCDFGTPSLICPMIYLPPTWQEDCRKKGGVPIPDDPYGCPRGECRFSKECPAFSESFFEFEKTCTVKGGKAVSSIDAAGCEQRYCKYGDYKPIPSPCPEVPQTWYRECERTGGIPQVESDSFRPACMKFNCVPSRPDAGAYCPSTSENEQRKLNCVAAGGAFFYSFGSNNCEIVQCHMEKTRAGFCPFIDTRQMTEQCERSGGKIAFSNDANGCKQEYCNWDTQVGSTCPRDVFTETQMAECTNRGGTIRSNIYTLSNGVTTCSTRFCEFPDSRVPTYSCPSRDDVAKQESICISSGGTPSRNFETLYTGSTSISCERVTCTTTSTTTVRACPTIPTCQSGSTSEITSYDRNNCPVYSCTAVITQTQVQPPEAPRCSQTVCGSQRTTCPAGQTLQRSSTPYQMWENGRSCNCESTWCQEDLSNLPFCTSCTSGTRTCNANEVLRTSDSYTQQWQTSSSGTTNQERCKCQSSWCETNYASLQPCVTSVCPSTRACGANEILRTSSSSSSMWENGRQCACASQWCETDYSNLQVCPAGSGCTSQLTCGAGQTLRTSGSSPYSYSYTDTSGQQRQCACQSFWCETDYSALPRCSAQSTTCTQQTCGPNEVRRTSTASGGSFSTATEPNGARCSCESSWCEIDYSRLTTCSAQACPQPTCTGGTLRPSSYPSTATESDGRQCACYSSTCDYSATPGGCASATCPSAPAPTCPAGQSLVSSTYMHYPSGCSSGISCQSNYCSSSQTPSPTTPATTPPTCQTTCPETTTPSCPGGTTTPSSYTWYNSCGQGIQCTMQTCSTVANQSTSPFSGFAVYRQPVIVRPIEVQSGFCVSRELDRDAFIKECLAHRWVASWSAFEPENVGELCKREVSANLHEFQVFCESGADIYRQCMDRSEKAKEKFEAAYETCKQIANREKVLELLKQKAAVECSKEFAGDVGGVDVVNDLVLLAQEEELPPGDRAALEMASDKIVLSEAELEALKAEIKRDVLTELQATFAHLFGARAEEVKKEAQVRLQQAEELSLLAASIKLVCAKISDEESKKKCEQSASEIEAKSESLKAQAQVQELTSRGLMSIVDIFARLLGGG